MDTDSFVIDIKTEYFLENIADDVEKWFDTSNYDEDDKRPLLRGKNKKVIGVFKDKLEGKVMKEFVGPKANTYTYLTVDDSEHKKAKRTMKYVRKWRLMVKNHKDCLFNNKVILKSQQRFKSDYYNVYTDKSIRLH